MSNKNNLVPKMRFPEFRDAGAWEEKRLIDISPSIFDGTHQTPSYTTEGIPFFSVENIVSGKANKFISREDYAVSTRKNKPEKNDVLLTRIGKLGFSKVVDWDYEFSIYVTLAVIKQSDFFISNYLNFYMQSTRYQAEIVGKSLLNAVPCKTNMDELRKTLILLPIKQEQQKIADCLSSIDDLVTAKAQKLDSLKAHKKGLMQQLFPAEGKTQPKQRFPEFRDAGAWKEKTLGEVFTRITTKNKENNQNVLTISAQKGLVNQLDYFSKKISAKNVVGYYLLHKGDFAYNKSYSKGYPMGAIKTLKGYDKGVISTLYIGFKIKNNYRGDFFEQYFDAGIVNSEIEKIAQEGGRNHGLLNVSVKDFFQNIKIVFPQSKEQQKIAHCLSSLDDIITSETQKLDSLKTHKKGLMQQLFPSSDEIGA